MAKIFWSFTTCVLLVAVIFYTVTDAKLALNKPSIFTIYGHNTAAGSRTASQLSAGGMKTQQRSLSDRLGFTALSRNFNNTKNEILFCYNHIAHAKNVYQRLDHTFDIILRHPYVTVALTGMYALAVNTAARYYHTYV